MSSTSTSNLQSNLQSPSTSNLTGIPQIPNRPSSVSSLGMNSQSGTYSRFGKYVFLFFWIFFNSKDSN